MLDRVVGLVNDTTDMTFSSRRSPHLPRRQRQSRTRNVPACAAYVGRRAEAHRLLRQLDAASPNVRQDWSFPAAQLSARRPRRDDLRVPLRPVASGCGVPAGAVGVTGPVELGHVALLSSAADVVGAGEASRGARERPGPYGHAECLPTPPRRHTDGATDPVGEIRSSVRVVVGTGGHGARRGVPPRRQ